MILTRIEEEYFDWMLSVVCDGNDEPSVSYRKLLGYLNRVEFTYRIRRDADRAFDGMALRHRFALMREEYDYDMVMDFLYGPCTVFEMILALAIRCEEGIMSDPKYGDRTSQWFWKMIVNLGLGGMTDLLYDKYAVEKIVGDFLERRYEPNGRGGLFVIKNTDQDLRKVEIWKQMMWYLDTVV